MPLPGQGLNYSPSSLLPVFNVGVFGSVQAAVNAAVAAGGGIIYAGKGTFALPATSPGIALDGSVPLEFWGVAPSGYNSGTIFTYSGAGAAFGYTGGANPYPANNGLGQYVAFQDLTIQCNGASYTAAIDASGASSSLPVIARGQLNLNGDSTQTPRVGVGWKQIPGQNQLNVSFDKLWVGNFNWGVQWEADSVSGSQFVGYQNYGQDMRLGNTSPVVSGAIRSILLLCSINATHPAIVLIEPSSLWVGDINQQGSGYSSCVGFTVNAEGTIQIPRIAHLTGSGLPAGYTPVITQLSPLFEHIDNLVVNSTQFAGLGFGLATPGVPGGTGSGNAVTNTFGTDVDVYLDSTQNGVHIIDWLGNDVALPSAAAGAERIVRLKYGEKIYFATAAPLAWRWYRH